MNKLLRLLTCFVIFLLIAEGTPLLLFNASQVYAGNSSSLADARPAPSYTSMVDPSTLVRDAENSFSFSPNSASDYSSFTFGNTEIGTIFDQNDANAKSASSFTCNSNGQITDIYAYVARAHSTGTGQAALYADNSGQPGALIEQSNPENITTSFSWVDFQLPSTESVTSGTAYWLSICSDDVLNLYVVTGSGVRVLNGNIYSRGFSNQFGSLWATDPTGAMSIYASVLVNSPLSVTISPTSANIVLGGYQQFTSTVTGGVSPYSYQWYLNDTAVSDGTSQNWIFTPSAIGDYNIYLTVTDSLNNEAQSNVVTDLAVYNQSNCDFSIMQITDTQTLNSAYLPDNPNLYSQLCNWIVNNTETYNLKMVVHTGDIINEYWDPSQWQYANNAMSILSDSGVPYVWCAGNHDQTTDNGWSGNPNSSWVGDQYVAFNPLSFSNKSYWAGDCFEGKNTAAKFSVGNYNFLVIDIEAFANDSTLNWMRGLLNTYSNLNYNIIVATHIYLASPNGDFVNSIGDGTWETNLQNLLDEYPKIFITLNGHCGGDPATNVHNQVNGRTQIEYDRQETDNLQGACSVRIYSFDLNSQTVKVSTYSVWNSTWLTQSQDNFVFSTNLTSHPAVSITPTHIRLYIGESQLFASSVSGGAAPYSYQWVLNGTAVTGSTGSTWTFTPNQPGYYTIYVNVTDSLSQKAQSNIVSDFIVYNQSQASPLVPDWSNVTQDFFKLVPGAANPVLKAADVTDRTANFVADPFMIHENNAWYMFFEVYSDKGEIGLATSNNGFNWTYQHIVLSEDFHLSYPYVFKWEGTYYMIPETSSVGQVRLYKATNFPDNWTLVNVLISDPGFLPCDSSIFRYNNIWWMFTGDPANLYIYCSYNLTDASSWHMHPMSPLFANDLSKVRGGGRAVVFDSDRIIRLTQKCDVTYGENVRAFEVDTLTQTNYSEHEVTGSPLVEMSGSGWNSWAMHNVDPWWTDNGWLAAVDGGGDYGWSIGIYVLPLNVTISPTQVRMDINQSQTFTSSVLGGTPPYTYQWILNDTAVPNATSSTYIFTPTQTGNYYLYLNLTDNFNNQVQSNIVNYISVYNPLSIFINPSSSKITLGGSQQFNSTVSGGVQPYTYQWYSNNTAVPNATRPTWTFTPNSTGTYNIFLNITDNSNYQTRSNTATINVYSQPTVTINPTTVNMTVNATQQFTSTLTGGLEPYSYQWYLNDTAVSEANASTWNFTPAITGHYRVYLNATDALNFQVQSNIVTDITVYLQPTVTISPTSINMTTESSQTFTSNVTGGTMPYSYQWYLNGTEVTGATSPSWTFTSPSAGAYSIFLNITDNSAVTMKSNTATVSVETPMTVNIKPTQVKIYLGQSQIFNSTVLGGTLPYAYQWYLNDTTVSGATNSNWTFKPMSAGRYRVYLNVTDGLNFMVQSNIVTDITVYFELAVSISPVSMNMTVGASQTFTSTVLGGEMPYTYKWYLNGSQIPNANASTWTFTPTSPGDFIIYLTVTDNNNASKQSNNAIITVEMPTNVKISPIRVRMYLGESQTFNSSVSEGTVPYTYQWYLNDEPILGAISQNWTFTPTVANNYMVYLNVTDALNIVSQSNIVTDITVYSQLTVSISPNSFNMTVGTAQTFTSIVLGGAQPYVYQWYLNGSQVPNANSSTWKFTPNSVGNFTIYLAVADNYNASAKSTYATIAVETATNVTISPIQVKMDLGQSQTFCSNVSGGTLPYSYQWYLNNSAVLGGINQNWTFIPTAAGYYEIYLNVTDALNIKVQSNIVTDITVFPPPTVSINPTTVNMTIGTSQIFSSIVSGGAQPYTYQWYLNGSQVPNANTNTYTFAPTSPGNFAIYLTVVDNNTALMQSNTATIAVETPPNVTITPTQVKMYLWQSQTFNSTISEGTPPYSYQWYLNDTAVLGATSQNWTFTPIVVGNYKIYLNITDALNIRTQSNIVTDIFVYSELTVSIGPVSVNMTVGMQQTFNSTISGGAHPYSYQWYLNGTAVSGANGANWIFNPTTAGTYNIYLNVTDKNGVTVKSNNATANVETPITVQITPTQVKMYIGQNQTFNSIISGGTLPYAYQWYLNDTTVSGATNSNWTFTAMSAGSYRVYLNVTDSLNFRVQSNIVTDITVYSRLSVSINPIYVYLTVGTNQTFSSTVSGGAQPYIYQWYLNGSQILDADESSWTFTPISSGYSSIYLVVTDNNTVSAQSNNATITTGTTLAIAGFIVQSGGSGYTTPAIIITGGGGTGATATARVSNGVIIGIVLTNPGSGYTSAPTISIRDPSPRAKGAAATAVLSST